jgi:glycosyltransferase involved in cell wall biosynthesis
MHIVMTRREALDTPDGINIFLFSLAEALLEGGHEVTVVGSAWTDEAKVHEFYPLRLWPRVVSLGEHRSVHYLRSLRAWMTRGKQVIRGLKPDMVILNGAVPVRFDALTCAVSHDAEKRMERVPFFRTAFKRFCYGKADLIVATCDEVRDALSADLGMAPERIAVIPTCVRLSTYTCKPGSARENAILHMGTVDYKNPVSSVRAFARTKTEGARLYITGKPTPELLHELELLPEQVRRRVELPGYVSAARLLELLGTVKVVSVPSNYVAPVASPTAIESLASATPVVASRSISRQVLTDGVNGYVCDSADAAAMAAGFDALLENGEAWQRMSAAALQTAGAFAAGRVADQYLRLAQNAVASRAPGGAHGQAVTRGVIQI